MSGNADARAITSLARALWDGLTLAQRAALRRARSIDGGYALNSPTPMNTTRALWGRSLVMTGTSGLSPLGLLVRAEGLAVDSEAARRRYSKRKVRA